MVKYQQAIDKDIKALEEKHQSLKGAISAEKYAEIGEKIEEIRRLGVDLPDGFDDVKVQEIINQMVDLQFDEFSPQFVEESTKEIKRVAFWQRLEHIRLAFEDGKDVKEVLSAAEKYWSSIEKYYDGIEIREVRDKLDEINLEITLSRMKQSKYVDMSKVSEKQNGLLIREKLQSLAESPDVTAKDKLLIQAWLGESVDIKTGKIDEMAMEKLVRIPKLWGVLAGVKEEQQVPVKVSGEEQVQGEESDERKQEIAEVCRKYGVDENKVRKLLDKGEDVYIVKRIVGHKLIEGSRFRFNQGSSIRAAIYSNSKTKISEVFPEEFKIRIITTPWEPKDTITPVNLETVIFPDNLEHIDEGAFIACESLVNVRLPKKLESIGSKAFACSGLERVSLPDSLVYLGSEAFRESKLQSVEFGENLKEIYSFAFEKCLLKSVEIPETIVEIHRGAFDENPMTNVILHEGLKYIGEYAFRGTKLRQINIPNSVNQYSDITEPQRNVKIVKANMQEGHSENVVQSVEEMPSLEELKQQKAELEELLAKVNSQLKVREQETDLEK